jgi:RsiW-degrading membrane proteinase PrsW (M82 family)
MTLTPGVLLAYSIIAAAIPTLLYIAIIYWADRYEKEPLWLLASAFLWGALPSIIIAFLFNTVLSIPFYLVAGESTGDILAASLIAPPVEETLKGMALVAILLFWRHEIDSPLDGIIYGAAVGMGFAMVENVYYFVNIYNEAGIEAWGMNILLRAVVFGLNHALFSSVTGLGIAIARMSPKRSTRILAPILGWMGAIFLHFVHNVTTSSGNLLCVVALLFDWGGLGLMAFIILWAQLQERRWIKQYLAEEVAKGTLTTNQYRVARSGRERFRHLFRVFFRNGPKAYLDNVRFFRRCSELAYKKHHYQLFRSEESQALVEKARANVAQPGPTQA